MHKISWLISYLIMAPLMLFAVYQNNDKSRMVADLEIIKNEIEITYAPAEWKKANLNWDLNREITRAREKILSAENLTPRQYQQIIRDLFNSPQDLHVGVSFYSTEFAVLPFLVQGVDNRYFVVWIDDHWSDNHGLALKIGDEILAFDGKPVGDIIREIQASTYSSCDSESYRHLSELQLTVREGDALQNVPQGTVEVSYKNSKNEKKHSCLVEWQYIPEEIDNDFSQPFYKRTPSLGKHSFFHKCRSLPWYTRWLEHHPHSIYGGKILGAKDSLFPPLGPITWKSKSKDFDAYIYSLKGKNIGYIRIPEFHKGCEDAEEFGNIIAVMQERTQALVVDVMNNPGGYAYYAYALASMLTDKPLMNLVEQMSITQEDVYFAIQDAAWLAEVNSDTHAKDILGEDICGYLVDKEVAMSILKLGYFIKDQFKEGKFLTDLYPLEGLEYIRPHPTTRYTKPILMLTNSLSLSSGDLLPALLQDNRRARILGCQTGGAGGYVLARKYSNRFGVATFTLTGSLIYRLDGTPLENHGVKPDFSYDFTVRDYTNNYADFINFVNRVLSDESLPRNR